MGGWPGGNCRVTGKWFGGKGGICVRRRLEVRGESEKFIGDKKKVIGEGRWDKEVPAGRRGLGKDRGHSGWGFGGDKGEFM